MNVLTPDEILANKQKAAEWVGSFSCIYFLIDGDEIVYVGQSHNFQKRLQSHRYRGEKRFTHVSFVPCDVEDLDAVEAEYIAIYHPKYNLRFPDFPMWFTLEHMAQISHIPLEHYRAHVERNGLTPINDSYYVLDFVSLHAHPPEMHGVEWQDGMTDSEYNSGINGIGREIYLQLGVPRIRDFDAWRRLFEFSPDGRLLQCKPQYRRKVIA